MWAKSVMHLRLSGLGVGITDKVKEVGRVGLSRPVTRTSVTYLSWSGGTDIWSLLSLQQMLKGNWVQGEVTCWGLFLRLWQSWKGTQVFLTPILFFTRGCLPSKTFTTHYEFQAGRRHSYLPRRAFLGGQVLVVGGSSYWWFYQL